VKKQTDFIRFTAQIKKVTSKIDVVGDKVATVVLDFTATDTNLKEINALMKPDTNVEVCMRIIK
jgi:hypothetical protein